MATKIQHKNITDPDIHEPKGVATATAGQVYIANGSGAGAWGVNPGVLQIKTASTSAVSSSNFSLMTRYEV